jgi:CheY-like chemotaxis protein
VVQIEQVLLNLSVNAQDAMPRGGRLTIQTAWHGLAGSPTSTAALDAVPSGDVVLTVRDTGEGMDEGTREHLFEPFFTTKGPAKGTGLGLSTVYGIVTQHGGSIEVQSECGRGTVFTVRLPPAAHPGVEDEEENMAVDVEGVRSGPETILLVEDDEPVRALADAILRRQGYVLLVAGDGIEALALLRQHSGPVDLLLTDVIMPEMNGQELYNQARAQRPGLRVIFMSGYATDVIAPHDALGEDPQFIQKPFTGRTLLARVRAVLDGEPRKGLKGNRTSRRGVAGR